MQLLVILIAVSSGLVVDGAGYNESVSCDDFPEVANLSSAELQQEANRHGQCIFYTASPSDQRPNPCNRFYTANVDKIYLPHGRGQNNLNIINGFAADANFVLDVIQPPCRDPGLRAVCYHYYPPCGNATHFEPPSALCQDICTTVIQTICQTEWQLLMQHLKGIEDYINTFHIQFVNCSQPGFALGSLPHCCSDAGIRLDPPATNMENPVSTTDSSSTVSLTTAASVATTAASVAAAVAVVLVVAIGTVIIFCVVKKPCIKQPNIVLQFNTTSEKEPPPKLPGLIITSDSPPSTPGATLRYVATGDGNEMVVGATRTRIPSGYIRNMSESNLLIPGRHIQLLNIIGQGEFGVVYKSHLTGWQGRTTAEVVAVKTLKSSYSMKDIDDLMKESEKMSKFDHPNVLSLIGVCIDAGEAPYIVMPFMSNGSLLTYLRKERPHFTIAAGAGEDLIADAQRKLLSICLQIAKGMGYLAKQKFVHRDLAARNCMIDQHLLIKVADFGLSEDVYSRNYFRQGEREEGSSVKLPIKWMALESLLDGVFTEKTDIWSYGVTCWEIFSLGHTPYPAIDPHSLIKFLQGGERLEKPTNAACTTEVYEEIIQCWDEVPGNRPSFEDLVVAIDSLLEGVAGYLDFSIFSGISPTKSTRYDHLENVGSRGYDHLQTPLNDTGDKQFDKN